MKVKKELDKRQQVESGGHAVNTVISPKFLCTQIQKKVEAKDFPVMIQRANKVTSSHISKHQVDTT